MYKLRTGYDAGNSCHVYCIRQLAETKGAVFATVGDIIITKKEFFYLVQAVK